MQTSLPYPHEPVPVSEDDQFTERLRGLSPQQLLDALTFVAFWSPGTFTAALDYCEATGWGWSAFGPDLAPPSDGDDNPDDDPAPVCARCGANLGIFLKWGLDWRHYRGEGLDDIELYDPGHAPEITWHVPATARPPRLPGPHRPLTQRSHPAAPEPGPAHSGLAGMPGGVTCACRSGLRREQQRRGNA